MDHDDLEDAGWNSEAAHSDEHAAELEREWQARREEFYNSGYRQGLDVGEHERVQEGFDSGAI